MKGLKKILGLVGGISGAVVSVLMIIASSKSEDVVQAIVNAVLYGGKDAEFLKTCVTLLKYLFPVATIVGIAVGVIACIDYFQKKDANVVSFGLNAIAGVLHVCFSLPFLMNALKLNTAIENGEIFSSLSLVSKISNSYQNVSYAFIFATVCLLLAVFLKGTDKIQVNASVNIDLNDIKNNASSAYSSTVSNLKNKAEHEAKAVEGINPSDISMETVLETLQYHLYHNKYFKPVLPFAEYIFIVLALFSLFDYNCFWVMVLAAILTFVCRKYTALALGGLFVFIDYIKDIKYHAYFGTIKSILYNISYYAFVIALGYALYLFTKTNEFAVLKEKYLTKKEEPAVQAAEEVKEEKPAVEPAEEAKEESVVEEVKEEEPKDAE